MAPASILEDLASEMEEVRNFDPEIADEVVNISAKIRHLESKMSCYDEELLLAQRREEERDAWWKTHEESWRQKRRQQEEAARNELDAHGERAKPASRSPEDAALNLLVNRTDLPAHDADEDDDFINERLSACNSKLEHLLALMESAETADDGGLDKQMEELTALLERKAAEREVDRPVPIGDHYADNFKLPHDYADDGARSEDKDAFARSIDDDGSALVMVDDL